MLMQLWPSFDKHVSTKIQFKHKEFISPLNDSAHIAFNMCDFPINTHSRFFPRQFCSPWILETTIHLLHFFLLSYYLPNLLLLGLDVTTLTLGSLPRQRHGKVWAKSATQESHSHFWECEKVWGNELAHFQMDSHFGS
jgi:hypothetical protein